MSAEAEMNYALQDAKELKTGQYVILNNALPQTNMKKLKAVSSKLVGLKSAPIYIAQEKLLGANILERYNAAGVNAILERAAPWLEATIGKRWLILANKVLLRRTWPISESHAQTLGHNASNLTWHQDSNYKHGSSPMMVVMASLDDGAARTRPGLSILELATNKFEGVFGYEGDRTAEFKEKIVREHGKFKAANPELNSGDLLIFNGLTFHRTFANQDMRSHRDALLVRVIRPEDAKNFPKAPHLTVKRY